MANPTSCLPCRRCVILLFRWLQIYSNAVIKAEELINTSKPDKEYLGITGLAEFTQRAARLAYGAECTVLNQGAVSGFLLDWLYVLKKFIDFRRSIYLGNRCPPYWRCLPRPSLP